MIDIAKHELENDISLGLVISSEYNIFESGQVLEHGIVEEKSFSGLSISTSVCFNNLVLHRIPNNYLLNT